MKYVKLLNTPQFWKLTLKGNLYSSQTTSKLVGEINYFETSSASKLYIAGGRSSNPNQSRLEKLFNRRNHYQSIRKNFCNIHKQGK